MVSRRNVFPRKLKLFPVQRAVDEYIPLADFSPLTTNVATTTRKDSFPDAPSYPPLDVPNITVFVPRAPINTPLILCMLLSAANIPALRRHPATGTTRRHHLANSRRIL